MDVFFDCVCVNACVHTCKHAYIHFSFCSFAAEKDAARREADKVAKGMNLSVVRLYFQAYLPDERGYFMIPLDPVFSQKVYDSSKSFRSRRMYMYVANMYTYTCIAIILLHVLLLYDIRSCTYM